MLPALGTTMTRLTAKALMYLVLAPGSDQLPSHTPLRRAGIDLIGIVSCFLAATTFSSRGNASRKRLCDVARTPENCRI